MNRTASRRSFLAAAGLALPVAASATRAADVATGTRPPRGSASPAIEYRTSARPGSR
jgi:hypothetical protein